MKSTNCQVKKICGRHGNPAVYWYWTPDGAPKFAPIEGDQPARSAVRCCEACKQAIETARLDWLNMAWASDEQEIYYTPEHIAEFVAGSGEFLKRASDTIIGNPPYEVEL